jgi:hypothetical protein
MPALIDLLAFVVNVLVALGLPEVYAAGVVVGLVVLIVVKLKKRTA